MTNVPGGFRPSGKKSSSVGVAIRGYPIAPSKKADSFGFEVRAAPVGENRWKTGDDDDPYVRSSGLGDICCLERASLAKPGKLIVSTDKKDTRVELDIDYHLAKGIAAMKPTGKKFCFPEQDAIMRGPQRSKLSVQFARILEACKITGHSFHDLRRSYACDCKAKGIPTPHIAQRLGHGSEKSTETYLH